MALPEIAKAVGANKKGNSYFTKVTGVGSTYERRIKLTDKGAVAQVREGRKGRFNNTPLRYTLSLEDVAVLLVGGDKLTDFSFPMRPSE